MKLVLGCLVMEERHTGEKMADFVEALGETWRIRSKENLKKKQEKTNN